MEKAKICSSLAEHFMQNCNAKQSYRQLNPESNSLGNYTIPASQLRKDAKCSAVKCELIVAQGDDRNKTDLQTFILCITCDRIFHERCTKFDFSTIKEENLPWICHFCFQNPMNSVAKALVHTDRHLLPFRDRILSFIKSPLRQKGEYIQQEQIVPIEEAQSSTNEIVEETTQLDVEQSSHEQLLKEHKELQAQFVTVVIDNEALKKSIQNYSKIFEQLTKILQSNSCYTDSLNEANPHESNCRLTSKSGGLSTQHSESSSSSSYDEYKYQIKGKQVARYIGYDLNKVKEIAKRCEICESEEHFSIECKTYREMEIDARYNLARVQKLCTNCMLTTTHTAKDCEVKLGCGYKVHKNVRCTAKHHISLHKTNSLRSTSNKSHRKQYSRANNNHNAAKAYDTVAIKTENHQPVTTESSNNSATVQEKMVQGYHVTASIALSMKHPNISEREWQRPYVLIPIATEASVKTADIQTKATYSNPKQIQIAAVTNQFISPLPRKSVQIAALEQTCDHVTSDYKQIDHETSNKTALEEHSTVEKGETQSPKFSIYSLNSCTSRFFGATNQNFSCKTKNIFLFILLVAGIIVITTAASSGLNCFPDLLHYYNIQVWSIRAIFALTVSAFIGIIMAFRRKDRMTGHPLRMPP